MNHRAMTTLVVLVLSACGGAGSFAPGTTTDTVPITTAPPTSESAPSSTAPAATGVTAGQPGLAPPNPLEGSEGAGGSGCSPGTDHLPDGVWFGYVLTKQADAVQFDLACFYFGDLAWEKAAEVGQEAPNDFFIVNDNQTTRTVPVESDATVWSITGDPTEGLQALPYGEWPPDEPSYTPCPGENCTVWLYVNGGVTDELVEQYLP